MVYLKSRIFRIHYTYTKNKYFLGQLAIDLAKDDQMRQVLSVRPLKQIQRTATRFEGKLLKRSRFLGWKTYWVVIAKCILLIV